jgi:hypothetical protein
MSKKPHYRNPDLTGLMPDFGRKDGPLADPTPIPVGEKSENAILAELADIDLSWQAEPSMNVPQAPPQVTAQKLEEVRRILGEIERRETFALKMFEALPKQADLIMSLAKEVIGYGSNRGAKTTACLVRFAMMVTGQHRALSGKPWGVPTHNGRAALVCKTLSHISRVIYPKLFLPGAFKIIRDEETGAWRTYRPWLAADKAREAETKPAPPLIPPELVAPKGIAWLAKNQNIPKRVVLRNGWEIYFFSSEGDPPRGDDYDVALFDEEMLRRDWYPEMVMRLGTRKGYFMWGATGQDGGEDMFELYERAESQSGEINPRCQAYFFHVDDNPYFDRAELELVKEKLRHRPDEYAARIDGKWLTAGFRVYPEFNIKTHGFDLDVLEGGRVPDEWARWFVVDPGRQTCAATFLAMPPSGQMLLVEDELYVNQCTAEKFAAMMATKMAGKRYEYGIIDNKAGAIHEMGSGTTVEQQYRDAMERRKLWANIRQKQFKWGGSDLAAGVEAVHSLLHIDGERGQSLLRVAIGRCPHLEDEFRYYAYRKKRGEKAATSDKPDELRHSHLMATLRYIALDRPRYRIPDRPAKRRSGAGLAYDKLMKANNKNSRRGVNFGPSSSQLTDSVYVSM